MKDNNFIRGKNPMTKMEIRNTIISYLECEEASSVLDIGAGTGSVSVQIAKQFPHLTVDAIEMTESGIELIKANAQNHALTNVTPILGKAPLDHYPPKIYDRIYIGGTGSNLSTIMAWLEKSHMRTGTIIVFSVITLESLNGIMSYLEAHEQYTELEGSMIQASRLEPLGRYHYFSPLNPCYVIKCTYGGLNV
ncbi:precorrin-6Y C5,15-methyltransferase (decarboxylating) subunit CbiT [Fusibacter ferrireducens]|uniref:Precorrin-6Y C5,15-methyltransferase (Decarboxylating) subunit CbiT n=1 Tax=Fusibacter ferrireducens TaxID=2785058 RepID=A0ABR9ZTQ0_9FIRM|nr:precorrin-6Y C5,15-methyltransferase (decarboxylating) subunit CbiT [Fusibacter ferrireducens]MBF4693255.1 precorrin-6Y C5,15-methyltransferase (decarboxylating) subunit CbiT [Fusibacter ferrireducens]